MQKIDQSLPKLQKITQQLKNMQQLLNTIQSNTQQVLTRYLEKNMLNILQIKEEIQNQSIFNQDKHMIENKLMAIQLYQLGYFTCIMSHILLSGENCNSEHKMQKTIQLVDKIIQKLKDGQDFRQIDCPIQILSVFSKDFKVIIKIQKMCDLQIIDFGIETFTYNNQTQDYDIQVDPELAQRQIQENLLKAVSKDISDKKKKNKKKNKKGSKPKEQIQEIKQQELIVKEEIKQQADQQITKILSTQETKSSLHNVQQKQKQMKRFIQNVIQDFTDVFNEIQNNSKLTEIDELFRRSHDFSSIVYNFSKNITQQTLLSIRNYSAHQWITQQGTKIEFTQQIFASFSISIQKIHQNILDYILQIDEPQIQSQEVSNFNLFISQFQQEQDKLLFD